MSEHLSKLGFGCMRFPRKALATDVSHVCSMVDEYLDAGFNYFDTAYVYPGSEKAVKKALVDRYPREDFVIASKLNAFISAPTEKAAKKQLQASLERTGAEYLDYYLLHALMANNYQRYEKLGLWDYLIEKKREGLIKHIGFSFHSKPELLDKLLTEHPEVEFVQLQINYLDWDNPNVAARGNYEVARRHGKSIIVMEPVKGGKLANPSRAVRELFDAHSPDMSYASWAIRFAASLEGVDVVLSGMSNVEQMRDNISYMRDFKPLDSDEMKVIQKAQRILGDSPTVDCTGCGYCLEGCPVDIPIPQMFTALNERLGNGQANHAEHVFTSAIQEGSAPGACVECGQCERACPQHLPVIEELKRVSSIFGK